jgi:hypothetical protein
VGLGTVGAAAAAGTGGPKTHAAAVLTLLVEGLKAEEVALSINLAQEGRTAVDWTAALLLISALDLYRVSM